MSGYIQVITTTSRKDEAEQIARTLVEQRLAACVQISGPIVSTYRWQGAMETTSEWQCVAKSRADLFSEIEASIRTIHPYEVPEILATSIAAGSPAYLAWLDGELKRPGAEGVQ
jgi:periplasmic divalent cation tolerance protein